MDTEWPDKRAAAHELIAHGNQCASEGLFDEASIAYQQSIDICPTAEGLTFLGWMKGIENDFISAIAFCKQAIELDPEFGNPYNDIGAYLIGMNQFEDAIGWLEKAKLAPRYDAPHFPYLNLGRLYHFQGDLQSAISQYEMVIELSPGNEEALLALSELYASRRDESQAYSDTPDALLATLQGSSTERNPFMVSFN